LLAFLNLFRKNKISYFINIFISFKVRDALLSFKIQKVKHLLSERKELLPIFFNSKKSYLFIHIPKTGGTSVELYAKKLNYKTSLLQNGLSVDNLKGFKRSPQHLNIKQLIELLHFPDFTEIFTIVRHPFYRAFSEYSWLRDRFNNISEEEFFLDLIKNGPSSVYNYDGHLDNQIDFVSEDVIHYKFEENAFDRIEVLLKSNSDYLLKDYCKFPHKKNSKKEILPKLEEKYKAAVEKTYKQDMEYFSYS